jgi:hypothetical protein
MNTNQTNCLVEQVTALAVSRGDAWLNGVLRAASVETLAGLSRRDLRMILASEGVTELEATAGMIPTRRADLVAAVRHTADRKGAGWWYGQLAANTAEGMSDMPNGALVSILESLQ